MADLADVEEALKNVVASALYPAGVPTSTISPIVAKSVRIYRDWPVKANLDVDLAAGIVNVSIFSKRGGTKRTTRYPRTWRLAGTLAQPTLSWTIGNGSATLSGTVAAPQNVALILDGQAVVYSVQAGDTLAVIVTALAEQLNALGRSWVITVSSATLTIQNAYSVGGRVGAVQTMIRELRRQDQGIIITVWAPDPDTRDAVSAAIDAAMSALSFLTLSDGQGARILYADTAPSDQAENETLFQRNLMYQIEYATTATKIAPDVVVMDTALQEAAVASGPVSENAGAFLVEINTPQ